ncbi:MAG: 30S ribosomal protein S1 [Bacteroidia bacterium]|nr:30S ribosomal protein S1 [Bacteroidia bacterium]
MTKSEETANVLEETVAQNGTEEVVEEKSKEAEKSEKVEKKTTKKAKKEAVVAEVEEKEFDWIEFEHEGDDYSEKERADLAKMYEDTMHDVAENEIIEGTIVDFTTKEAVVNIGFKSEGVIPLSEFRDTPDIKIGDKVDVLVDQQEDKNGQLVLSRRKAKAVKSWDSINSAYAEDTVVEGFVKSRTKGGLIVDVMGLECFLPGSQIDTRPIRDYDAFVNKNMELKVVKINHEFKNVVVSHKILIEEELAQQRQEIMSRLEKGQVLEGTVKNITDFGVFIDLGGVDGLLHITDISWGRIEHPNEVLELDQKINVVVLDFDDEKKRIALGLKQLTEHPWDKFESDLSEGTKVKGKIVTVADYGAFVEISTGVGGLIHVSEMTWSSHMRDPNEFVKVGDVVDAVILTLDKEERKMSLGIKQLSDDPWLACEKKYPIGSKHKSIVRNITNFGVFVEVEEGVDGLIHISDLSWSKKIKHPSEFVKVGEDIEIIVLEFDKENKRLTLGHKQLEDNPWDTYETIFIEDSVHKATVTELSDKGAVVLLPHDVEGYAPARHLVKADGEKVKVGEDLDFKVLEFSKDNKRILVSHTNIHKEVEEAEKKDKNEKKKAEAKSTKKSVKRIKNTIEKSTLGDIEALSALKSEMEGKTNEAQVEEAPKDKPKAKGKKAEPKAEAKKEESPKEEEPKAEVKKEDSPKEEEPKAEAKKEESSKEEEPKAESKKEESSKEEEPKAEESKKEKKEDEKSDE